jgi:hypothetical protein
VERTSHWARDVGKSRDHAPTPLAVCSGASLRTRESVPGIIAADIPPLFRFSSSAEAKPDLDLKPFRAVLDSRSAVWLDLEGPPLPSNPLNRPPGWPHRKLVRAPKGHFCSSEVVHQLACTGIQSEAVPSTSSNFFVKRLHAALYLGFRQARPKDCSPPPVWQSCGRLASAPPRPSTRSGCLSRKSDARTDSQTWRPQHRRDPPPVLPVPAPLVRKPKFRRYCVRNRGKQRIGYARCRFPETVFVPALKPGPWGAPRVFAGQPDSAWVEQVWEFLPDIPRPSQRVAAIRNSCSCLKVFLSEAD